MPIAHYGALLLLLPCPNFSKKYRKSPSPLCALSKLADIVVNPSTRPGVDIEPVGSVTPKVQQMSEAQLHELLEENPDAIIIVDRTGRINFASHRVESMLGHLPNELVGKLVSIGLPKGPIPQGVHYTHRPARQSAGRAASVAPMTSASGPPLGHTTGRT